MWAKVKTEKMFRDMLGIKIQNEAAARDLLHNVVRVKPAKLKSQYPFEVLILLKSIATLSLFPGKVTLFMPGCLLLPGCNSEGEGRRQYARRAITMAFEIAVARRCKTLAGNIRHMNQTCVFESWVPFFQDLPTKEHFLLSITRVSLHKSLLLLKALHFC